MIKYNYRIHIDHRTTTFYTEHYCMFIFYLDPGENNNSLLLFYFLNAACTWMPQAEETSYK